MASIARDHDFAVAGRESMGEPSMPRRAPGVHGRAVHATTRAGSPLASRPCHDAPRRVHGRAAHATTSANTHGLGLISTNRGGTKRYYHFDALGTTWALTSGSGTVTDTYSYTAFGVLLSSTGSSVNPYRFVGQWGYYDDGARGSGYGLSLLGVRYYSAGFGRFWSWDPIEVANKFYFYGKDAPQQLTDPSGLITIREILRQIRIWFARSCTPGMIVDCWITCEKHGDEYLSCEKLEFSPSYVCYCLHIDGPLKWITDWFSH